MSKFTILFIVSVTLVSVLARNRNPGLKGTFEEQKIFLHDMCIRQSGVDSAIVTKWINHEFVEDQKMKCYLKCLLMEMAVMDDNGAIDAAPLSELLPDSLKEPAKKMLAACTKKTESIGDLCEKGFILVSCAFKEDPQNIVIF